MKILFYILPFLAGVAMAIQSGVNSQLRIVTNHPLLAAFISFTGGTIALAILLALSKQPVPAFSTYSAISWYKFTGGLFGVFVVYVVLLSVREIGVANMFVLLIAGQLCTAVIIDHLGILGMKESPVTLQKLAGILFVIAGAYLVNRK
jgi:bacterial/archaeal transporter family-2 protein